MTRNAYGRPPNPLITCVKLEWANRHHYKVLLANKLIKLTTSFRTWSPTPRHLHESWLLHAVGIITSMGPVMGSLTRIMTRHCQMSIACSFSWDSLFDFGRYYILELEFWQSNLKIVNCRSFTHNSKYRKGDNMGMRWNTNKR
jgi:hypothetical protein